MSISSAQRARLGIFIVVAVAITIVVFAMGIGFKLSQETAIYYSQFEGESLSGLSKGMEVKFRGIPIGNVANISYDPADLTKVLVQFEVEKDFPMKTDMIVETGMVGITGLKYIEIMGGTNDATILPEGSYLDSKQSLMASLTDKVDGIMVQVETLLTNLNTITNPDSLGDAYATLENVASLTENLDNLVISATPRMDTMSQNLASTLAKVDEMVTEFSENSDLSKMMNDVDTTILAIRTFTEEFNLTFEQSREDISITMVQLTETMENLNDLSQLLLDNPSLILRGSPQTERRIR